MINIRIPLAKPSFDDQEIEAVRRVLTSAWVVQGPEVEAFEKALARLHQTKHCIAVSSGTAALHICYLSLGIGLGDAVFIPSFAWPSAANMAMAVNARPVFVDVLADTYNIDPDDLRMRIKECLDQKWGKPKAIVPVHEFGLAADMDAIIKVSDEFNLMIIEDAACALGTTYKGHPVGSFGALSILSFHPRKSITTGEGGAILTNDDELADKCQMWRNHGQVFHVESRDFPVAGFNYRMTEIQAAIGQVQLKKFPEILKKRKQLASQYLSELVGCPWMRLPADNPEHTWQTLMVVLDSQIDLSKMLNTLCQSGIGAGKGSVAAHCMQVYKENFGYKDGDLPQSSRLDHKGLALPLYPDMRTEEVSHCLKEIRAASC
jgi:dTDP-4-amino-4,6-dideoxygalactose transaminase